MGRQTYLLRRHGRYHFRRRFAFGAGNSQPIMLALGTADPVDARRIVNRLAVRWDMMSMQAAQRIDRGTLTLDEQRALFRQGLEQELADATRHVTARRRPEIDEESYSKVAVAAYAIVGSVPHDTTELSIETIEAQIGDGWTDAERRLLLNLLRLYITPMTVSRSDAVDALEALGAPVNDGTATEARWNLIRGRIEAQRRAPLVDHPLFAGRDVPALYILDDDLVEQARRVTPMRPVAVDPAPCQAAAETAAPTNNGYFARSTTIRFSEQLDDMLATMILNKKYKPDNGQRRRVLQTFAWITSDKPLSDYGPEDRIAFVKAMTAIPNTIRFGELGKSGPMAIPFDASVFDAPTAETLRSGRTINRDLTILAAAEDVLHETHWRPRYGGDRVLNFLKSWTKIEEDFADPRRVPWTPEHLRTMYALPLWQGGGGASERIKPDAANAVWQDAAYWLPLFGTYMGVAREEGAGFEVVDFNFDCEVPYVLVQANMTRSKDGITKAGLKRKARHRVMPLHPQLLRLGIQSYVETIEAEGHAMIFPELYLAEAKYAAKPRKGDGGTGSGSKAEAFGGRRFYAISWCFLMDATHGVMPLPETSDGKKADFHSQRTYNNSVLASPEVSQTIIDKHMGHAAKGTGPRRYNRRALALGEVQELRERLDVMVRQMPIVTEHVPVQATVNLLPLIERSRVGSAQGRNAKHRFCA